MTVPESSILPSHSDSVESLSSSSVLPSGEPVGTGAVKGRDAGGDTGGGAGVEVDLVDEDLHLELRSGLPAAALDGELMRLSRARNVVARSWAFYLDEMLESGKYAELGYSCLAQYADQRLGIDPRRAREYCQAGRVLVERPLIDRAFLDGALGWTKVELLTHGVREHEQEEWIERAVQLSCVDLKRLLMRHRKGLSTRASEGGPKGGLPGTEEAMMARYSAVKIEKLEKIREQMMRRTGALVDDDDLLNHVLDGYDFVGCDEDAEEEKAARCEQEETPDWLRRLVLARDGVRCGACESERQLQVHHVVWRRHGGLTRADNLVTTCCRCHALIHEGRLFARVESAGQLVFRNRCGERIGPGLSWAGALPLPLSLPVQRVLRQPLGGGGQTPLVSGGLAAGSLVIGKPVIGKPVPARPMDTDHSAVPDAEMGEWVKAGGHLVEVGPGGALRLKKSRGRAWCQ